MQLMVEGGRTTRSRLLKTAAHYSAGTALGLFGGVARVAIAARLLPHDLSGKWLGLQLVFNYGQNLHLGVLFGMFRNVPLLRARGEDARADTLKRTCLSFVLLMCLVSAFISIAWATFSTVERRYVVETSILTIVTLLRSYYTTLFRAESRFRDLSASSAIGSVVSVASLAMIWRFKLDGLICGMIAQTVTELVYLLRRDLWPKLAFNLQLLKEQVGVGVLTLLVSLGTTLLTSLDRTVMLQKLGATATGYYYLGANAVIFFPLLAGLPAAVITPRFFERVGREEPLLPLVEEPVRIAAVGLAAILGAGAIAVPAIVLRLWPALYAGNDALLIALVATFPIVLSGLVTNVFYALNRLVLQIAVLFGSSAVSYCAAALFVRFHQTVAAAAIGSALGLFVYYVGVVFAAYAVTGAGWRLGVRLLASSFLPLLVVIALVAAIRAVSRLVWIDTSIAGTLLAEIIFVALMAPWVHRAVLKLRGAPANATAI